MSKFAQIIIIFSVLSFLTGITSAAEPSPPPNLPMAVYGSVTIGGAPAPVNTVISAKVGKETVGSVSVTSAGYYGGKPNEKLPVSANKDGDQVDLYVNNVKAKTITYKAGTVLQADLSVAGTGDNTNSGGSSGANTAGSSGNYPSPTPTKGKESAPGGSIPDAGATSTTAASAPQQEPEETAGILSYNLSLIAGIFGVIALLVGLYAWKKKTG